MSTLIVSQSIHKKWMFLFSIWFLFLSGLLANFLGTPGIIQAVRLQSLLTSKREQLSLAQVELRKLRLEATLMETSPLVQEKEIRRVLGYAATDEIIFDLSNLE